MSTHLAAATDTNGLCRIVTWESRSSRQIFWRTDGLLAFGGAWRRSGALLLMLASDRFPMARGCEVDAMKRAELVSIDGIRLDAALHQPTTSSTGRGTVVQAHGITADMDEGGMFVRLADELADAGFTVLRFSFRGHGRSGGTQQGATIAGEMLDLQAAVDLAAGQDAGPLSIVAASFGAVATSLSLPYLESRLRGLVLWNPVLDLHRTFVDPELAWGVENFGSSARRDLQSQGYLVVDGEFRVGRVLFEEMRTYEPVRYFAASRVPALVIHGDKDTAVPYDVAKNATSARPDCELHTVAGSDHGFDSRDREDEAIAVTVAWLVRRYRDTR